MKCICYFVFTKNTQFFSEVTSMIDSIFYSVGTFCSNLLSIKKINTDSSCIHEQEVWESLLVEIDFFEIRGMTCLLRDSTRPKNIYFYGAEGE